MKEHEKPRATPPGQIPWEEGEREFLISEALAKGNVTKVQTGERGPEQARPTWRRQAPQAPGKRDLG